MLTLRSIIFLRLVCNPDSPSAGLWRHLLQDTNSPLQRPVKPAPLASDQAFRRGQEEERSGS